jgi:DNA invertase Pin-like site-specific DNA recombinase
MSKCTLPAAQYLRMSSEEQHYSFAMQREAIRQYAQKHGYEVTKSYEDAGKSGIGLKGRQALKRLLNDVLMRSDGIKAILVYDVSRWGRFQDCDEAAHYEFLCKEAGASVHYCAEQFTNDQTAQNSILKAVKRTMAGEYSRELSRRSYAGHKRAASSGIRPGGPPGYGLRRVAISADGKTKRQLLPGERKAFPTDRVTLVLGPKEEVARVREIFKTYLQGKGKVKPGEIARRLNRDHVPAAHGGPWTMHSVLGVLTNPKYVGKLVWGQTTQKLRTKVTRLPVRDWIMRDGAFEPTIQERTFSQVQAVLKRNCGRRITDRDLIRAVRSVFSKHGRVSESLMGRRNGTYSLCTIYRRFGSAKRVYDLIGFDCPAVNFKRGKETTRTRDGIVREILAMSHGQFAPFRLPNAGSRANLVFESTHRLFVWVALHDEGKLGEDNRWILRPVHRENDAPTLLSVMRPGNNEYEALYLLPALRFKCTLYKFGSNDVLLSHGVRLRDLSALCRGLKEMIMRVATSTQCIDIESVHR